MTHPLIIELTDDNFQKEVLDAELTVLVDYWAEWCGPCKQISPILDELAVEYDGKLKIGKLNVDQNKVMPAKYNVRGIPTLMIFQAGLSLATKVGATSKSALKSFIDDHLK